MGRADECPNPLLLFNNHFSGHRRHYPYVVRLAIAADLGYDGYEFHPIEPTDHATWDEIEAALQTYPMQHTGMYVTMKGATEADADRFSAEIERLEQIVERLARITPKPFLNLALASNPSGGGSGAFEDSGSAKADERDWRQAAQLVKAVDRMLETHQMVGNLYNHVWFFSDTPQAILRMLADADAQALRPGIAGFHAHFHPAVPDPAELLDLPGMARLGYVALLNALPAPPPFRTVPIDQGQIDIAGFLALLWQRGYTGPLVLQGYDLGGDPYATAERSIAYVRRIWSRLKRNPNLNPYPPA